jgi:hypothetical protein
MTESPFLFQIYVFMDDSETLLANMTLPPTPTSVIIGNLVAGSSYSIRAAAWTLAGVGPASDPASFSMEVLSYIHRFRHFTMTWTLMWMIPTLILIVEIATRLVVE